MALRAPANAEKVTTSRGELELWLASPDVVIQRIRGHASLPFAEAIGRFNDRLIRAGKKPLIFNDWEEMTGYDSDSRPPLTEWTARNRESLRGINILVHSKLVAMGIAVANLATGGITKTFSSRAEFEQTIAQALRESTLRPPP